jgi:hypothetical protein
MCWGLNAQLNVSISIEIAFLISPNTIFLNDSNELGCYFFFFNYYNLWIIHVQSLANLPKSVWKLVFNVADVNFSLQVLKIKPTKSRWIMTHVKLSKTYVFRI